MNSGAVNESRTIGFDKAVPDFPAPLYCLAGAHQLAMASLQLHSVTTLVELSKQVYGHATNLLVYTGRLSVLSLRRYKLRS